MVAFDLLPLVAFGDPPQHPTKPEQGAIQRQDFQLLSRYHLYTWSSQGSVSLCGSQPYVQVHVYGQLIWAGL